MDQEAMQRPDSISSSLLAYEIWQVSVNKTFNENDPSEFDDRDYSSDPFASGY